MVSSERIKVTLIGGAPWGFRFAGGGALPLTIKQIRKKSRAHVQGLLEGDAVISINGTPVHDKSQDEAVELLEKSDRKLVLEIFRGDVDELNAEKPKKPIQIGGGAEGGSGLILTASVDDVSSSSAPVVVEEDTSSELILTASVDDVSSDTFAVPDTAVSQGLTLTATVDDVSGTTFDTSADDSGSGFILTASVDDMTSSTTQFSESSPVISAELGEITAVASAVDDTQTASFNTAVLAEPFIDSEVNVIPARLSPQPPAPSPKPASPYSPAVSPKPIIPQPPVVSLSPQPQPVSPKPASPYQPVASPKPTSPYQPVASPKPASPYQPVASPKPASPYQPVANPKPASPYQPVASPQPVSFVVANNSPSPRPPPPVSPKPSQTTSSASTATFDDGQTRREVAREHHVTTSGDGRSTTVVQQESTKTTTTKRGPSFVKSQTSAFNPVSAPSSQQQFTQRSSTTSSTLKTSSNFTNKPAPPPSSLSNSFSSNYLQQQPQPLSMSSSKSISHISQNSPAPVFKPSKFVPGPSKKDIPGLYGPMSPKLDVTVTAMYNGKENMAPMQPMFQVKNFVSEKSKSRGKEIWRPNVWLPGQQPGALKRQPSQQSVVATPVDDFSPYTTFPVPSVQAGISLADHHKMVGSSRASEFDGSYMDEEDSHDPRYIHHKHHKLHVFAPPVEIHAGEGGPESPYDQDGEIIYDYEEYDEDGPLSPNSLSKKKNLYSDSAFYDTPGKCYPTITEQMKLCKKIAQSLTSAANKRARGAKMFMRRKRKSNKWVHEGQSEWSSSAGDVPNIRELDSELSPDEDGKALFYFKIPNLKNRVGGDNKQTKMALTQEQFEKLRLNSKKCDHKNVAPDTCFDIAADLKAHKGRGGRMFERRKQRSDKFVIANDNPQYGAPQRKLEHVLTQPVRQEKTPWEAAMEHGGKVDAAFSHISEMERNQKLNQILKMSPPRKLQTAPLPPGVQSAPLPPVGRVSLRSDGSAMLIKGKNFNRSAVGWQGGGEYPVAERVHHVSPTRQMTSGQQSSTGTTIYGNYNNKVKAWQAPGDSPYATHASAQNQWDQGRQDDWQSSQYSEPAYSSPNEIRPPLFQPRPKSWQSDGYETTFRDDYEYNYVPVSSGFEIGGDQPKMAYMQPIIPGTDL